MPLPTLLREGFLVAQNKKDAEKYKKIVPKDFIMDFLSDRMPQENKTFSKIRAKNIGDRVLVLKASTGSGKSTAFISNLYRNFYERIPKNIAVTQPRVLTAVDIALGLPEHEPLLMLDKNIGYSTGVFKRPITDPGIMYLTVETLVQQLATLTDEQIMKKYGFIIIDEVHERDLSTDNCLYLLKKFLERNFERPGCPFLILTSATFDEKIFIDYFGVPKENYIIVEGFTYEKTVHWPEWNTSDYFKFSVKTAFKIHVTNPGDFSKKERDVLIFMSTGPEIDLAAAEINKYNYLIYKDEIPDLDAELKELEVRGGGNDKKYMLPVILTRTSYEAGEEDYRNLFIANDSLFVEVRDDEGKVVDKAIPGRRIFIATNVAETGVTIYSLKYCIDTGYSQTVEFNPELGCSVSLKKPITKGAAIQRKGRVGRAAPGDWFPAYNSASFDTLLTDQFAKILTSEITDNLLTIIIAESETEEETSTSAKGYIKHKMQETQSKEIKAKTKFKFQNIDFVEYPSAESVVYSLEKLNMLGFITLEKEVTVFGFYADKIRFISPESKRMIFSGYAHKVPILDLITMASIIYAGSPREKGKIVDLLGGEKNKFFLENVLRDDLLYDLLCVFNCEKTINNVIQKAYSSGKNPDVDFPALFADMGINYDNFLTIMQFRDELITQFVNIGLDPYKNQEPESFLEAIRKNDTTSIQKYKKCIYEGYRMKLCVFDKKTERYSLCLKKLDISIAGNLVKSAPQNIIIGDYSLKADFRGRIILSSSSFVSILDDYVFPDKDF